MRAATARRRLPLLPTRGDSLAAYSILLDRKLPIDVAIPYDVVSAVMSLRLDNVVDPTRAEDRGKQVPADIWRKAKFVFPFSDAGIMGPFNKNFSEFLDWNDPDPPLFKSFLRVDARPGQVEIRCFAATGCEEHADDPPLEDHIKGHARRRRAWPGRCSLTENGHWQAIFEPLRFRNLKVKNRPALPLEHLRTLRQLRRLRHGDAHRLGRQVRPRRDRRDHLRPTRPSTRAASSSPTTRTSTPTSGSPSTRSWGRRVRDAGAKYIVQLAFSGASGTCPACSTTRASPPRTSPTRCTASRASG